MKTLIVFGLTALVITGCRRHHDDGPLSIDQRNINATYHSIRIDGAFDVHITQDTSYDIKIQAGAYVIPYIETYVLNHELVIHEEWNHYKESHSKVIYVSAQYLDGIRLDGSGNVHAANLISTNALIELHGSGNIFLEYDSLSTIAIDLDGSGNLDLEGTCTTANYNIEGSGNIDAKHLVGQYGTMSIGGSGNIKTTITNDLTISISGSGNVYYWGNPPNVTTSISGSGSAIHM